MIDIIKDYFKKLNKTEGFLLISVIILSYCVKDLYSEISSLRNTLSSKEAEITEIYKNNDVIPKSPSKDIFYVDPKKLNPGVVNEK